MTRSNAIQEEAAAAQQPAPVEPSARSRTDPQRRLGSSSSKSASYMRQNVLSDEEFEREKAKLLDQA